MMSPKICVLLILSLLPLLLHAQNMQRQTCSRENMAVIQPTAMAWMGGIVSLNAGGSGGNACGSPGGSIQAIEAIRMVLDLLNKKDEYLLTKYLDDYYVPGIRLGMKVRNYCDRDQTAIASTLDFFPELMGDASSCSAAADNLTLGIVGPSSSGLAMTLSDMTVDYDIPVVSYEATATQLTLPGMFTNFMRTIPPDGPLMEAIIQLFITLDWKYVAVVYDSGSFGRAAYKEFHAQLLANDICLTTAIMVDADDESTTDETFNKVLSTEAVGAIYFGPANYASALIREGNSRLPDSGRLQWVFNDFPVSTFFANSSVYQRGVISVSAASRKMAEFEDHWHRIDLNNPSDENPWFTEQYEYQFQCKFNPTAGETNCNTLFPGATPKEVESARRAVFVQDQVVEAAVSAVYTYANALRKAQIALCPGVPGACPALQAMTRETFVNDYLKKVDLVFTTDERIASLASTQISPYNAAKHLRFTANGDIVGPSYDIWNYNDFDVGATAPFKFRKVATYINNYLDLNMNNLKMYDNMRRTRIALPSSPCPSQGCTPCLGLPADLKYYFEQGDVIINGIFSLHNIGTTPLTCGGKMSDNQYEYLEAMIYAVRAVNQDNSILNNIMLGGLGIDDCSSTSLSQAFLAQVQRGSLVITDQSGSKLDARKIEAYTAAHTSDLTLPLAEAMNMLMRPMVGYRAGSSELDDKMRYPYYIRSVPGIYNEVRAIILLLKRLGWMYVQVVTSHMDYSQNAEEVFRDLGAKAGICIVATHNIGYMDSDAARVVEGLRAYSSAPPTIVLLEPHDIRRLLMALDNTTGVADKIRLIGTTRWSFNPMIVKDLEEVANGAITLSLLHSPMTGFMNYLRTLDVNTHSLNPWFKEWFAAAHNCSLDGYGSGAMCNTSQPITQGQNFMLMYEVESVINAVEAIARGLHSILQQDCGAGYTSICSTFLTSQDRGARFLEEIKKVAFPVEDVNPTYTFRFVDGSADIPFEIQHFLSGSSYGKAGSINVMTNSLSLTEDIRGNTPMPTCVSPCLECLYMFNHIKYWYIPGDVVIGGIFDIHYSGTGPFSCGDIRYKNGALYTEVFNFALQKINSGSASVKLRNVTLGGLAFDGCSNPSRATAIVNRVHTGMEIMDSQGHMFMTSQLMSWLSYDSETTIDTASLVQKLNLPIVSPGATSSTLDDKSEFYTFFRTIPSDSVVVRGMAQFINEMGWRYVIVLNAPDESNRMARDQFRELLRGYGICIVANYEFETDGSIDVIRDGILGADTEVVAVFAEPDRYIKDFLTALGNERLTFVANRPWGIIEEGFETELQNSVFFELTSSSITEFITYLEGRNILNSNNPWLKETYQAFLSCSFPGSYMYTVNCSNTKITNAPDWEQDIWTLTTINAVYALAEGIHRTLMDKCGASYTSVCTEFIYDDNVHDLIMMHMDAENFTDITNLFFRFMEREADRGYRLMRYTGQLADEEEGTLSIAGDLTLRDKASLTPRYTGVQSACTGDCLVCSASDADLRDFTLIEGDVYIVGLFDVHKQGGTPFTCGDINNKHGLPLLEAFNFALEFVNNRSSNSMFSGLRPGVQFGGVGLDMCKSPSRAANLVANIHSGTLVLEKDGVVISPRRIDAYVATMDTESSTRVADILTQLAVPQISYGATGMDLLDRDTYRYFLRSVPADDKQARAMVSYLKKFQYNNIQVIGSFDEIGEPGMVEFKRLALINRICIYKEYVIGERGNFATDAAAAINKLQANPPDKENAQVVILWLKDPLPVLEAASANSNVRSNYLFIATDKWGADPDYLKITSIRELLAAQNLVILDVETADIPKYDEYLENKTPDNYQQNPWFKEFFEMHGHCYWDNATAIYTQKCDRSATIPRIDSYVQDPYVLYVINAVFSAVWGINNAINKLCQNQIGEGVCDLYAISGERRQEVMSQLLKVNYTDDTHQPFFFTEDGQSDRGFHIYNITQAPYSYQNVGSYNDSHFLKLDITYTSNFDAMCFTGEGTNTGNLDECVCDFPPDLPSRFMIDDDGGRGLTLVYVGDVHQADPNDPLGCGPINTGPDLQKLLAFFYAIHRVNSNPNGMFMESVKLNGLALDSCTHALRLGQDVYNVLSGNRLCDSDEPGLLVSPSSIAAFVIDQDHNALPVANILSQRQITTISPTAGNALLDDRFYYKYFLRTRGGNSMTSDVIFDVADQANWDFLSVVYSDTIAHEAAKDTFLDNSFNTGKCVGDAVSLPVNATLADAQRVLQRLSQQVGARAVVLFVEPKDLKLLMQASEDMGLTGRFIWLLTDDWNRDGGQIAGYEQELAGSLMIEARSAILADFTRYVMSLNYTNRGGIPDDWFQEIYETLHQCNVLNLEIRSRVTTRYSRICNLDEKITADMVPQDPAVLHVIISVLAVAHGLNEIPNCQEDNSMTVASCLQDLGALKNDAIYNSILLTSFNVLQDQLGDRSFSFSFDREGNGQAGYTIRNYQASDSSTSTTNPYVALSIGNYTTSGLTIDLSRYAGGNLYTRGTVPSSNCALGATCQCKLSGDRTWSYQPITLGNPTNVRIGGIYTNPKNGQPMRVDAIPETGDRFKDTWAIILTVLACIGSVVSAALFIYLLIMYPVRGGTSILGFILSFGIVLLYLMVFPFIAHADERICGLRRFGLGFVYSIVYAAMFVKLVDCWRVRGKDDSYNAKYSKLGRPFGLFMVTFFLVLVQVMINAEWLILREPNVVRILYNNNFWPLCTTEDFYDEALVLSLVYIMAIIAVSIVFSLFTFTSTKNHRESRWIFGILVLSIPTWVIWCAVSILAEIKVRDAAVAVGLLVNATIMLLLIPIRKLYLLHKYNVLIDEEEEKQSTIAASHRGGDYNSVYGRQYDNNPRLHDAGSTHGSSANDYARAGESHVAY